MEILKLPAALKVVPELETRRSTSREGEVKQQTRHFGKQLYEQSPTQKFER
jgi:hypothetical protein